MKPQPQPGAQPGRLRRHQLPSLFCSRAPDGHAIVQVPHVWPLHSPTGMEFGYGGSGPADTALNYLLHIGLHPDDAERLHQEFKFDFVAKLPHDGGSVQGDVVAQWLRAHGVEVP